MANKLLQRLIKAVKHPPSGLAGAALWLALCYLMLELFRLGNSQWNGLFAVIQVLDALAFFAVAIPLVLRFVRARLLWSLRSRLVLTYLLFGLAPVVLGLTLVSIFAYFAAGQFSIHLMESRLAVAQDRVRGRNVDHFVRLVQAIGIVPKQASGTRTEDLAAILPGLRESDSIGVPRSPVHSKDRLFLDGVPVDVGQEQADVAERVPLGLPAWAAALPGGRFGGLVLDGEDLYVVAIGQQRMADNRMMSLMTSLPIDRSLIDLVADGLGRAELFAIATNKKPDEANTAGAKNAMSGGREVSRPRPLRGAWTPCRPISRMCRSGFSRPSR